MKLIILGSVPPKKNSRINTRSGRSFPNNRYVEWENSSIQQVVSQAKGRKVTEYPTGIVVTIFNADLRRHDLDNQLNSLFDMLVKAGVLEDDNQKFIDNVHLYYGGLDRDNPRAEIELEV